MLPKPTTSEGRAGLAAILDDPNGALAAFDYDGTLSPIVRDPAAAFPEHRVVARIAELSGLIGTVAIVTGRPAQQALELGGFAGVSGLERLVILGQYGVERWDAGSGLQTIDPPPGVDEVRRRLPDLLHSLALDDAELEDKRISIVVHVRNLDDPTAAFDRMQQPLRELAESAGLVAEPGRHVVEMRPSGMDKGQALRSLVDEFSARSVMFTGDDLGDLPAFAEVRRMREAGTPGLLLCSGSDEVTELAGQADLVLSGPAGVAEFVGELTQALSGRS